MNPFTPSFGNSPPVLVGREEVLGQLVEALENGPGALGQMTIVTGARGTGKTVLLNEIEDRAQQLGWRTISETATSGFVERLVTEHLPTLLIEIDPEATSSNLTGLSIPGGGGFSRTTQAKYQPVPSLRSLLTTACDILAASGSGLLLTIDELHHEQVDEVRELGVVLQHLVRENRAIAFVGAGLPVAVNEILNDDVLTFLRRADREQLGSVSLVDVIRAITDPIESTGRTISPELASVAASATGGYPFLIQLVGYQVWRQHPDNTDISSQDVAEGIDAAKKRLGRLVHQPAVAGLTRRGREFLQAAADEGAGSHPVELKAIAYRMGVSTNNASQYRAQLLAEGLIRSSSHGYLELAVPFLADYLASSNKPD